MLYLFSLFVIFQTFKCIRLETFPSKTVTINKEQAERIYTQMATIRRLETVANGMYTEKIVRGFCHLYTGQEAVCVGRSISVCSFRIYETIMT